MNLFKIDGPIFNGLTRICDMMILNVLWVLCSIPIITMGAATTALYYSMLKINRKRDSAITGMFFHSFFQNLKQGCGLTLLFFVTGILLYVDIQACKMMDGKMRDISMIFITILFIIWGIMVSYVFPTLAQFDNTSINILKNSFIMSINNFHYTILILILNAIPSVMLLGLEDGATGLPIVLTFGIAITAFLNAKLFIRVFDKYISNRDM